MKRCLILSLLSCLFVTCPVMGQVIKRQLTEADYGLWSTMDVEQLSEAGKWISYSLHYESGKDTLFVKHTSTLKTYAFAGGGNGRFANDHYFACQDAERQLLLTQLANGKREIFKEVSSYTITFDSRFLIMQRSAGNGRQELFIRDLQGKRDTIIPDISGYSYNPKANALVCNSYNQLLLFSFGNIFKKSVINYDIESVYSDFTWQKNGESVAYFARNAVTKMGYYRIKEQRLSMFDPSQFNSFPKGSELYNASNTELTIADDGNEIFFGVKAKETKPDTTDVQVWNTTDKSLYPEKQLIKGWVSVPKLGVWFPVTNYFRMVTNLEFPYVTLTGDQKHALLFNPIANEPQFDRNAPVNFYLSDLTTGNQELLLERQSPDESKLSVSVTGKYIAYFKDRQWWVYDITTRKNRCLTMAIGVSLEREDYDRSGEKEVCGIAGWNENDDALLVYDSYDVWLVKTDGSTVKRLTDGREKGLRYRVVPMEEDNVSSTNFNWVQKGLFHLKDGLILQGISNLGSGYFYWSVKKGLQQLVWSNNKINNIKMSKNNNVCIYTEENYHISPQLKVKYKTSHNPALVLQSNPQQKNYQWGFSKLISYENSKGQLLHGALFYPAGYTPDKSYPMVVQVYEMQSVYCNQYVNPTLLNPVGFNAANFTAQGYFVLLPDIAYEEGNPGRSAVDCVTNAVKEVLAHESVDPKRLGLVGHSFGGYETNFIITQTDLFATAVSSAGVSDIISDYLYMGWNTSKPNGWRYEFQQARMGKSLFEDYQGYIENSPIAHTPQVHTPLLLWSGEADKQVYYYQSLEFHLALRRLQKPNILLLYPGERHVILGKEHQIDLTYRVEDWLGYYLKGGKRPEWFTPEQL